MPAAQLEISRSIADDCRAEGKLSDLATPLLHAVLAIVAGANSHRQVYELICIIACI